MKKKTVIYYTSTHYLDVILETIQSIKNDVELHVLIEITPSSKNTTIIDVDTLDGMNFIETPEKLLGADKWNNQLKKYFNGVASVHFVVHTHKRALSFESMRKAYSLGRFLKKYKADIVHFDSVTSRSIGLYPYLRSKKVFIAIHDPVQHSGESDWKEKVPPFVFYGMAKGFFFYSKFARDQFKAHYTKIKAPFHVIKLQPYTFVSQFLEKNKTSKGNSILFFGRLSYYKGIDLLLGAIPSVLEKYPNEKFIIAGKPSYGYQLDEDTINKYKNNIEVISRFLSTEELVRLIQDSKFVVCPYRDATQSGVVMTAFAGGKMVIATDVGSFSEYIVNDENGYLAAADASAISSKIIHALDGNRYLAIESAMNAGYDEKAGAANRDIILNAYTAK
ncbi:MAG: glycosyltransferase family 4 protein [Bacteroidetes bacterium]|nr:glycosyltransferase family 4 protein [Bacteroidota bacterium]